MQTAEQYQADPNEVLGKAVLNAGQAFGMTSKEIAQVIKRNGSLDAKSSINPNSEEGKMAMMLVRCYRSLSVLMGGNADQIKHWFNVPNLHLKNKKPIETIKTEGGLVSVTRYLDAIRGKI